MVDAVRSYGYKKMKEDIIEVANQVDPYMAMFKFNVINYFKPIKPQYDGKLLVIDSKLCPKGQEISYNNGFCHIAKYPHITSVIWGYFILHLISIYYYWACSLVKFSNPPALMIAACLGDRLWFTVKLLPALVVTVKDLPDARLSCSSSIVMLSP